MIFQTDTLSDFKKITGFDVVSFFIDFSIFTINNQQNIIDYYSGISKIADSDSFSFLNELIDKSNQSLVLSSLNKNSFNDYAFWNLIEQLEIINTSLLTLSNSSKFLRSAVTNNSFNSSPEVNISLKQNQNLEAFSRDVLDSDDANEDWADIALRNDLNEEAYTPAGGNLIKASFQNGSSFFLNSVVDNLTGEKVYGQDIAQNLSFQNNDLLSLSYRDTLIQSVKILSELKRGDNQEFPTDGLQSSLIVGSNLGSLAYPPLFRQLFNTFAGDDSLKSFTVTKVEQRQDAVFIEFQIETRLGEVLPVSLLT